MNRMIIILSVALLAGCTYTGQNPENYIDEPATILQDPHFGSYQQQGDELERQYLEKKMTYADYLEKKRVLDDKYSKDVKKRDAIISPEQ